jgi:hypothetical protein
MKNLMLLLTTLLAANFALATPENPSATQSSEEEAEAVTINNHLKVISKSQNEEDSQLHYTINATYPQITGNPLSQAANSFNQQISNIVNSEIQQFKHSVKRDLPHMQTLPEAVRNNSFSIDYDVDVIHPDKLTLISVRLNIEGMQAGRAHPFHMYKVLNFDLTHGKELALSDLFKPKTNYLQTLSQYSTKKLNSSLQDKWMIASGAKANTTNYKNWNLQDDSILITFDDYQVAPYSNGPQEVEIPYSALQKIFSSQALIISSAKNYSNNNVG